ncbi:hypothetical protein E1264_18445 [Actinomadura sp. KC216]|uniref:hypothetical protein n=1 Tax=Actinomadura sp. KC216 TaxID=2530370 RepID=UPI001050699F|nr:hypothetical protein [Actinomadura sp. KC216]TDB86275.1 hypothetical protein E1264_18445 [Actinomadura sp. KC216]
MATRRDIRDGVARFFGGATYDSTARIYRPTPLVASGLAGVRPYWTTRFQDQDYTATLADGRGMGGVMSIHIANDSERRIALGGPTGGFKSRPVALELWVWHMARTPATEDAQADLDDLLDAIVERIHTDRTLGGAVVEAGESQRGIQRATAAVPQEEPGTPPTVRQEAVISLDATVYPQA